MPQLAFGGFLHPVPTGGRVSDVQLGGYMLTYRELRCLSVISHVEVLGACLLLGVGFISCNAIAGGPVRRYCGERAGR